MRCCCKAHEPAVGETNGIFSLPALRTSCSCPACLLYLLAACTWLLARSHSIKWYSQQVSAGPISHRSIGCFHHFHIICSTSAALIVILDTLLLWHTSTFNKLIIFLSQMYAYLSVCVLRLTTWDHKGQGTSWDWLWDFWHSSRLLCSTLRSQRVSLSPLVCRGMTGTVRALHSLTSGCQLVQMFREAS